MTRKSYGASKKLNSRKPFEFSIGEENFDIAMPISNMALVHLVAAEDEESNSAQAAAATMFFRTLFGESDYKRFIRSTGEVDFTLEDMQALVVDVVEASSTVPTQPQSASPVSSSNTGPGSAGNASETTSAIPTTSLSKTS